MIRVAGMEQDSITNGPGLRFALFVQGCPHGCAGCHNPKTHPFDGGELRTMAELLRTIRRNPLTTGVTLSGGEPFCQAREMAPLARELRIGGYEIAVYSGFTWEELLLEPHPGARELLEQCDILVDGRYIAEERDLLLRFRGSANQRILDVPASLTAGRPVLSRDPRWRRQE